jgi:hypothetical protein
MKASAGRWRGVNDPRHDGASTMRNEENVATAVAGSLATSRVGGSSWPGARRRRDPDLAGVLQVVRARTGGAGCDRQCCCCRLYVARPSRSGRRGVSERMRYCGPARSPCGNCKACVAGVRLSAGNACDVGSRRHAMLPTPLRCARDVLARTRFILGGSVARPVTN